VGTRGAADAPLGKGGGALPGASPTVAVAGLDLRAGGAARVLSEK